MWYPSTSATFSGWPTRWQPIPSLNDPADQSKEGRLDFVGDNLNPSAYWSSDGTYFFIRIRVAVSNVTSTTFHDAHWIYIDRVGYTNGTAAADMPDYAIVWDSKSNDPSNHGLELNTGTNLSAKTSWSDVSLPDIDGKVAEKISPPDFNLTGDGYIRTIDMQPTTNFGYTTYIEFAVNWSFISANTALGPNQTWRLQLGSRNDSTDHNAPQDDIAGGFSPSSLVTNSWSSTLSVHALSSSMDLSAYATDGSVQIDLWTVNENGNDDIVIFAWIDNAWKEIGRVLSEDVVGEGSNHYTVRTGLLSEGNAYLFKVLDESGHEFCLSDPVSVRSIRMSSVTMELQTMQLTFNTDYGRSYVVKVSDSPTASADGWTTEYVRRLTSSGWSALSNQPFMAETGTQTRVQIPLNRSKAFYKIVQQDE